MKIINDKRRYAQVQHDGKWFDLDKKDSVPYETILEGDDSIFDAYKNPSYTKVCIWNEWVKWFYHNDGTCAISSKNCNFFTVHGYFTDKATGKRYYAIITYANHKLYEVEG